MYCCGELPIEEVHQPAFRERAEGRIKPTDLPTILIMFDLILLLPLLSPPPKMRPNPPNRQPKVRPSRANTKNKKTYFLKNRPSVLLTSRMALLDPQTSIVFCFQLMHPTTAGRPNVGFSSRNTVILRPRSPKVVLTVYSAESSRKTRMRALRTSPLLSK